MKLSDFVAGYIADLGVRHVFLLPGGGNMHLVDSVGKEKRLEYIACLHEQVAAIAADAYGNIRRGIGVALVTTGPGGTNAITGVAGAWVESVPLLMISGQVKTPDIKPSPEMRMLGFQEVDITAIVRPITKYAVTVRDPQTIQSHLEKAVYHARSGRPGPVWIDIPLDVQAKDIDPAQLPHYDPAADATPGNPQVDLSSIAKQVISLLGKAERPIFMAGYGIKVARSEELFRGVVDRMGVPVLTTWKGCDLLPDNHPLFFGRPGTLAQRGANFIQQNADFVLAVGARLDFGQIGYAAETFARAAKKIIVDIDPLELAKFKFKVDVPVVADAGAFLNALVAEIDQYTPRDWSSWIDRCKSWKTKYPVVLPEHRAKTDFVSMYVLVDTLSDCMTEKDILVPGSSGACSDVPLQMFRVKQGQIVQNSPGFGAMGFGIPHTIGACIGSGRRRTICILGDGGFQLNIQDLETIHRLQLPIKYFILNNQGYGSIRTTQNNYFKGHLVASDPSSGLSLPDISRISEAYRIPHNCIRNHKELLAGVQEALASEGPFISEVMVDPNEQTMPKVQSVMDANGRLVSKPLEDLAPFLEREEFLENMLIPPVSE
ncbi:MAG TPA: thiamine pyrophosphate-binding protein [Anaerolineaceae bacterium]